MNELLTDLSNHHKDLLGHVAGAKVVDEHHLTGDQLLAMAREFYDSTYHSADHVVIDRTVA